MLEISQKTHKTNDANLEASQKGLQIFLQRKDIGFSDLPFRKTLWSSSTDLAKKMSAKFKKLVIVGIGGSSAGPQVIIEMFHKKNVFVIDNVDPVQFKKTMDELGDLEEICWTFISKSGTTIETLCTLEYLLEIYSKKGLELAQQSVVITENHPNSLFKWAQTYHVPTLEIPKDVGGRFSILSPVGIFPAAFVGLNVEDLRKGAMAALKETSVISHTMAQFLQSFQRQEWLTLFWFYNSNCRWFGVWLQQLWAESLGKATNREKEEAPRASSPLWAIGACDQHSILQQVMEGARDKFVCFFRFEHLESGPIVLAKTHFPETEMLKGKSMGELLKVETLSTQEALEHNRVSTMTFKAKGLDEATLGFLFMFFELVVAGLGEVQRIDAFDQPGVELGKRLAKEKLLKS